MKQKERILIIDDDESIGRSLALIFGRKGYETETAKTAQEGLEKALEKSFHVALIDIQLPDMSGIELLKKLKEINPVFICMIITGHASIENAVKALDLGTSAYITKPLDMDNVLNRIKEALDKQQLEQDLMESEEKYRTLFNNTGTATVIIEEDMTISMANTQCEKLSGYSKEEIENKMKWTELVVPEDLDRMRKFYIARREAGAKSPIEYEFRLVDKKGNMKNIFINVDMITNTKKSIASMIDISELKKTQEGLRSSREEYFNLFNNANDLIQAISPTGEFLAVNKKWLETLEYSQEEVKGLRVTDIIRKDKLKQINEQIQEIKKEKNIGFETVFISKSGKEINVEGRGNGLYKDGKLVSMVGIFRDITERNKAEKALAESEEKFRITLKNSPIVVWNQDKDLRYTWIYNPNPEFKPEETIGKTDKELLPADDAEKLMQLKRKVLESGIGVREETKTTIQGNDHYYDLTVEPLRDSSNAIIGITCVAIDITSRRKTEQELMISEEELKQSYQKLKKTMDATLETMSKIIEVKDPYTSGHQTKVSQLATSIAKELNLPLDKIEGIRIGSLIHDIGKIGIPTEILNKSTVLSDIEFSLIKEHSQIGYGILKSIDFSCPVAQIVLQHHERLNGSGYPNHLKTDKILMEAKIIGVADVVEAMSSHRPYRPALGIDAALEEISKNKGTLYDPEVVEACLKLFKEKGFKFE